MSSNQFYRELYDRKITDPPQKTTSSADTENAPPFTEREVEACLKDMSTNKAPGPDQITSDVYKLGGEQITKGLTILMLQQNIRDKTIPSSWNEANSTKKEIQTISRTTGRSVFLPIATNYLPDCCKREWRRCWIEINHENKQDFAKNFQQTTYIHPESSDREMQRIQPTTMCRLY